MTTQTSATPVSESQRSFFSSRSQNAFNHSFRVDRSRNASGTQSEVSNWTVESDREASEARWVDKGRRRAREHQQGSGRTLMVEVKNRIFVGGLNEHMNEDDLRDLFGKYGEISEVLIKERGNMERRGFGFVTYANRTGMSGEEAATCARREGSDERLEIKGAKINVQRAHRNVHTTDVRAGQTTVPQPPLPMLPMPFMPPVFPTPAFYPPQFYPYGYPDMYGMGRGFGQQTPAQWPANMMPAPGMWPFPQGFTGMPNSSHMMPFPSSHTTPPPDTPLNSFPMVTPTNSASRSRSQVDRSGGAGINAGSIGRRNNGLPNIRITDYDAGVENLAAQLQHSLATEPDMADYDFSFMHSRAGRNSGLH